jgi:hypothetical protein
MLEGASADHAKRCVLCKKNYTSGIDDALSWVIEHVAVSWLDHEHGLDPFQVNVPEVRRVRVVIVDKAKQGRAISHDPIVERFPRQSDLQLGKPIFKGAGEWCA